MTATTSQAKGRTKSFAHEKLDKQKHGRNPREVNLTIYRKLVPLGYSMVFASGNGVLNDVVIHINLQGSSQIADHINVHKNA